MRIIEYRHSYDPINNDVILTVQFRADRHKPTDLYELERIRTIYQYNADCGITSKTRLLSFPKMNMYSDLKVEKVIFNNPATIVFWNDGSKTVVKCGEGETFDEEKGFAIACTKKMFGNNHIYYGKMQKAIEKAVRKETDNDNSKK